MTERLYYREPYLTSFDATVLSADPEDGHTAVVLDRTAFYPTSGGQPFDRGTLAGANVLNVIDREDGAIVHVLDRPLPVGARVSGRIDWARRFDHMQQHTGQHVLSAAYDRLFGVRTESFHLGAASSTIDLAREVSPSEIRAAEDEANRIVWEDRPVSIRFATAEEAAALPLRKETIRTGPIRLIEIQDFDLSACGGTHVGRTGAIGVIATAGWERFRGGTRVEFLCGVRALERFRQWRDVIGATTRHLSVTPSELAAAVERMQGELKAAQKSIRALQTELAGHEGRLLASRATPAGARRVIADALEGWDANGLKALASAAAAAAPDVAVALASRSGPPVLVVAAGASSGIDASAVIRTLTTRFNGRGGGKRDLAQGGGFAASVDDVVAEARRVLSEA